LRIKTHQKSNQSSSYDFLLVTSQEIVSSLACCGTTTL